MILIADSGSTKTDWRLVKGEEVISFSTIGFNPYFVTKEDVLRELKQSELKRIAQDVRQVYFYGAGCASSEKREFIKEVFLQFFSKATIAVEHDLLGAARATCKDKPGMAAILGTGSNTCIYNGEKVIENIPALGYILGDEGSGAHLGKSFIKAYLGKELSEKTAKKFYDQYQLELIDILNAVYKESFPNRFLASFSPFIYKNINDIEVLTLVKSCFNAFFDKHICRYDNYKKNQLHLVGSVAYYYQDIISEIASEKGLTIGIIIKQPIEELVTYHKLI